jgi:hypothetical protein
MTRTEIVAALGKERRVETMVSNIARRPLSPDLQDLAQIVYTILLTYDPEKIIDLYEHNEINYFIARVITNQMQMRRSQYDIAITRYQRRTEQLPDAL